LVHDLAARLLLGERKEVDGAEGLHEDTQPQHDLGRAPLAAGAFSRSSFHRSTKGFIRTGLTGFGCSRRRGRGPFGGAGFRESEGQLAPNSLNTAAINRRSIIAFRPQVPARSPDATTHPFALILETFRTECPGILTPRHLAAGYAQPLREPTQLIPLLTR
jgi:hypothetical protein